MEKKLGKVLIGGQEVPPPRKIATPPDAPPAQIGKVYINGREAVHKGCGGMAIAFPDVCLCPPGPPAGPVPVPLTNVVQAKDMVGGALSVVIQGYPAGHKDSRFVRSTGNETAANTGGGVTSHVVQGEARFASGSPDVVIEGKPAARHGDLLRQNANNCPPSTWMGAVCPGTKPARPPRNFTKILQEGDDWIEINLVDETDEPIPHTSFRLKTPKEPAIVEGRCFWGGKLTIRGMASGRCELVLPEVDEIMGNAFPATQAPTNSVRYRPGRPLLLVSGKSYRVFVAQMRTLFIELPLPSLTGSTKDRFVLRSDDDRYCDIKTVADDLVKEDDILTLAFPKIIKGPKYTLSHDDSAGKSHDLFVGLTFEELFPKEARWPDDKPTAGPDLRFGVDQRRNGG